MPIPVTANIEGYPAPGSGDRHVLVLDNNNCWLYELYSSYPNAASWNAGSAAVWDLTADEQRPYTWTSADAAGLPIFPGLARYDEVAAGHIDHALRFTLQSSRAAFMPPASHWAANSSNALAAPMGMRLRLKASFDVSSFSAANQVILNALKKYGMIMADNGSSMYISGAPDDNWNNGDLHNLGGVTAADFDVVQMNPIYTSRECSGRRESRHLKLHCQFAIGLGGHARHSELECYRRVLLDRVTGHRRRARHERSGLAEPVHDVYALRHECFWKDDSHIKYYGALSRTGFQPVGFDFG